MVGNCRMRETRLGRKPLIPYDISACLPQRSTRVFAFHLPFRDRLWPQFMIGDVLSRLSAVLASRISGKLSFHGSGADPTERLSRVGSWISSGATKTQSQLEQAHPEKDGRSTNSNCRCGPYLAALLAFIGMSSKYRDAMPRNSPVRSAKVRFSLLFMVGFSARHHTLAGGPS